jgi:hypothetical protein
VLEDHKLGGSINAINPNAATRNFRNRIRLVRWIPEVSQTPDAHVLATFVVRFALPIALFVGVLQATPKELENLRFKAVFSRVAAAFLQLLFWLPILGAVLALSGLHLSMLSGAR